MHKSAMLHADVTEHIIKAFYHVYNSLGYGFLEKVYENALVHALLARGLVAKPQLPILVFFEGALVGEYFADVAVNDCLIVEVKACDAIHPAHQAQLLNYLKATRFEVGLLLNFGSSPEFRRKLFTNDRKAVAHPHEIPHPSVESV